MTNEQAEMLLDMAIPKTGHPISAKAIERINQALARTTDPELIACLKLFRMMVADCDPGLYEHISKTNPTMWNDSTFNGIRTWFTVLKTFAAPATASPLEAPESNPPEGR